LPAEQSIRRSTFRDPLADCAIAGHTAMLAIVVMVEHRKLSARDDERTERPSGAHQSGDGP
jgi:hypothetical protein